MDLIQFLLYVICRVSWFYTYICLFCFTIYIPMIFAYSCSRLGTKLHYYLWKLVVSYPILFLTGLLSPIFLLRPRSVMNARLTAWFLRKISFIVNTTWELRGANIAGLDQGCVICCNHQSAVDIFGKRVLNYQCAIIFVISYLKHLQVN